MRRGLASPPEADRRGTEWRAVQSQLVEQLELTRVDGACGAYFVRRHTLLSSEHIGTIPVSVTTSASTGMLAALAKTPALDGMQLADGVFVDTETTGFIASGHFPFVVGLAWIADDNVVLEQVVLPGPEHERAFLHRVREVLGRARFITSYNGKSFDLPMLQMRWVMNRLEPPKTLPHLDLLHVVRRIHRCDDWDKSLTSSEQHVLGLWRGPDVSGWEVAGCYGRYVFDGDVAAIADVLEHNAQDVLSLVALAGVYARPLRYLSSSQLAAAARVMSKVGAARQATALADRAVHLARGDEQLCIAFTARAQVAKALGDKRGAMADLETALSHGGCPDTRLELAKLYEHFLAEPARALAVISAGTSEDADAHAHRCDRLRRKAGLSPVVSTASGVRRG